MISLFDLMVSLKMSYIDYLVSLIVSYIDYLVTFMVSYIHHRCSGCLIYIISWGRRGGDRMVVGYMTTHSIITYHH